MLKKSPPALDKIIYLLPFFILTASLVTKIVLYTILGTEYWGDEIIATVISRQNLTELINTISSEPHPPGFYIFLKLFPVENVFKTRTELVLISHLLTFLAIVVGYRSKILDELNFSLGISLFLTSYTFLELTAHVRHETISFPLFLFFTFILLKIIDKNARPRILFLLLNLFMLLLLSFSYVYYFIALLSLFLATLTVKNRKLLIFSILLQLSIILIYSIFLGFTQFKINFNRLSWQKNYNNNFLEALNTHLYGNRSENILQDFISIIYIFLLIFYFFFLKGLKKRNLKSLKFLAILSFILLILSYPLHLFIRTRYSAPFFFFLSIFAGNSLSKLKKYKLLLIILLVILFSLSATAFKRKNTGLYRLWISEVIKEKAGEDTFGFIEDNGTFPLEFVFEYKIDNLIPVNVFYPRIFENKSNLKKELLAIEGSYYDLPEQDIKKLLSQNNINNFFYRMRIEEKIGTFDPNKKVLRVLDDSCQHRESIVLEKNVILFVFRNCKFI